MQRGHRELLLPRQVQRRAAGDQDPRPSGGGEQVGDEAAGVEHLLHVVEDQQDVPLGKVAAEVFQQRGAARVLQPDAAGDRHRHQRRVPHRGQRHEVHAVREVRLRPARQLDRQPRLAAAARPGQREQPRAGQQASRLGQLALPAHEARRRSWQHARSSHHRAARVSATSALHLGAQFKTRRQPLAKWSFDPNGSCHRRPCCRGARNREHRSRLRFEPPSTSCSGRARTSTSRMAITSRSPRTRRPWPCPSPPSSRGTRPRLCSPEPFAWPKEDKAIRDSRQTRVRVRMQWLSGSVPDRPPRSPMCG